MTEQYVGDLHILRTFDGQELHIPDEENKFTVYIGYGAPPIEYITRRGYKQHGETKIDYVLSPRVLTIQFWKKEACDRATYWANRLALHEILRPNRGGSIEMVLTQPNNIERAIKLDPTPGAQFITPQLEDNTWNINETLQFIAFDPIWYNPTLSTLAVAQDFSQNLVFPIVFPIEFGPGGVVYTATINYDGTWRTYPTMIIQGPYSSVTITNGATGAVISLNTPIIASETRTLTLTPGALGIVDQDGNNAFGELSAESNLVDFVIEPLPIAPSGINTITANIFGASGSTTFTIEYQERFFAI